MEVSLGKIRLNYRNIKNLVKKRVIAVVKADAFGMGAVRVAWSLKAEGADYFAVATPDEALELRAAGIPDPILVLGASPYEAAVEYVRHEIRATITDLQMAKAISDEAARQNRRAYVHLKIDTGMGRIGFFPHEVPGVGEVLKSLLGLEVEGVFTHFAKADESDLSFTRHQFGTFMSAVETVRQIGLNPAMVHCCNSGALLANLSDMFCDAVRPGHILHGLIPAEECGSAVEIAPCFEVKTAIGAVRELPDGAGVGYSHTYTTSGTTMTAILPVGYVDGYSRLLSNRGEVLIHGKRCPVIGRICMDQTMVDVSNLPGAHPGEEVVLIGRQGGESVDIGEIAGKIGGNTATIPVMFNMRVPRIYVE
jgi:alanine racemase